MGDSAGVACAFTKMSSQKEIHERKAKELMESMQQAETAIGRLKGEIQTLEQQKSAAEQELPMLQKRMQEIQAALPQKKNEFDRLRQIQEQKESAYMSLLEASPSLVQVMKK